MSPMVANASTSVILNMTFNGNLTSGDTVKIGFPYFSRIRMDALELTGDGDIFDIGWWNGSLSPLGNEVLETGRIYLNGGQIRRKATTPIVDADLLLRSNEPTHVSTVAARDPPRVVEIYSTNPASGTYYTGSLIQLFVSFDWPVLVLGAPILTLDVGRQVANATYQAGNKTDTLEFWYLVRAGHYSQNLSCYDSRSLSVPNGGILLLEGDMPTIPANLTLPPSRINLAREGSVPQPLAIDGMSTGTIIRVFPLAPNGTYGVGDIIDIAIEFSNPVIVAGVPTLTLDARYNRSAYYTQGDFIQTIDVLVSGSSAVMGGEFALSYNGETTDCIQWNLTSGAENGLYERVMALESMEGLDILVSGMEKANGYRFTITFTGGLPEALIPVNSAPLCLGGEDIIAEIPASSQATFRYVPFLSYDLFMKINLIYVFMTF